MAGTSADQQSVPILSGGASPSPPQQSTADAVQQSVSTGTGGGALGVLAGNAFGPSKDLDPKNSAPPFCLARSFASFPLYYLLSTQGLQILQVSNDIDWLWFGHSDDAHGSNRGRLIRAMSRTICWKGYYIMWEESALTGRWVCCAAGIAVCKNGATPACDSCQQGWQGANCDACVADQVCKASLGDAAATCNTGFQYTE